MLTEIQGDRMWLAYHVSYEIYNMSHTFCVAFELVGQDFEDHVSVCVCVCVCLCACVTVPGLRVLCWS